MIGIGRLGTGVYYHLATDCGEILVGIDINPDNIDVHKAAGRNVVVADVTDDDVWENTNTSDVKVGILAPQDHQRNLAFLNRVRQGNPGAKVFAVARHQDEVAELVDDGAVAAWIMH